MTDSRLGGQVFGVAALEPNAEGAATTLRELFDMYAPYVWNTLRRLGASPCDLEDLTHDVFLQVHRHIGDYQPGRPVRPWLFAFAIRIASQQRRRAYRRREMHGEPDAATHRMAPPPREALDRVRSRLAQSVGTLGSQG